MQFIIPIDKKTIRHNPNSGNTAYQYACGPPEVREVFINGILVEKSVKQPMQTIYSLHPASRFLFEYEDTFVSCRYCESNFSHNDLKQDYTEEGYSCYYCPKCGWSDCLILEYEKMQDSELEKFAALNQAP